MLLKKRTDDDMRRFHAALDFTAMWQGFYSEVNANNTRLYRSVNGFVKKGWKSFWDAELNEKQTEFLIWYLGSATPVDEEKVKEYPWASPQDWEKRREDGGWYSNASLRAYSQGVRQKMNALEALQEVGNGITINAVARVAKMMEQLDRDMNGSFFAEGLSYDQNKERARMYVELQGNLLNMLDKAQDIYAKAHGINFHDMSGFEQFMSAAALLRSSTTGGVQQSNGDKVLGRIIEMTLEKSANHGIPIPEEMKKTVVAVVERPPGKKNDRFN